MLVLLGLHLSLMCCVCMQVRQLLVALWEVSALATQAAKVAIAATRGTVATPPATLLSPPRQPRPRATSQAQLSISLKDSGSLVKMLKGQLISSGRKS